MKKTAPTQKRTSPARGYGKAWILKRDMSTVNGCVFLLVCILVVAMTGCSGCINKITKSADGEGAVAPADPVQNAEPPTPEVAVTQVPPPGTKRPVAHVTPMKSEVVMEVTPFTTPDPYPAIRSVRINSTPRYAFIYRQPEFTRTYSLKGNAIGLLINVVQGPLYIKYTVNPKHDCLKSPDSCRGTVFVSVNRPYMTLTVRDNATHEVVAVDGYAGEFSSNTGNYKSSGSDSSDEGEKTTATGSEDSSEYVENPGPRYIAIHKEGRFQVTMEGNYLDVTLSVITGSSPDPLTRQKQSGSPAPVPGSTPDEWE